MLRNSADQILRFGRLALHLSFDVLVYINKHVSGLIRFLLPSQSLLHQNFFSFFLHRVVVQSPPKLPLTIVNERVVVSSTCKTVMDKNRMQIIGQLAIVAEGFFNLFLKKVYLILFSFPFFLNLILKF